MKAIGLLALLAGSLGAGTLVVSGDSNLGNGINGTSGASVVAGNKTFFSDLLGGGSSILIQTTTNPDSSETTSQSAIVNYYGTTLAKTVTQVTTVTSANLAGENLFISFLPDVAYTGAEMSAIQGFLNSGGTVLLTGEYNTFDAGADNNINALLTFLSSPLSLSLASFDLGFHTASGGQILSTPLSAGITSFEYAATTNVNGGTPVFLTSDLGHSFLSFTSTATTPEPGTGILMLSAVVLGLGYRWRAGR